MYVTLQIQCDSDQLWDVVRVCEHGAGPFFTYYEREVYQGHSHAIALHKAFVELEALLTAVGWLEPAELDVSGPTVVVA